jgi:hypothetical protein
MHSGQHNRPVGGRSSETHSHPIDRTTTSGRHPRPRGEPSTDTSPILEIALKIVTTGSQVSFPLILQAKQSSPATRHGSAWGRGRIASTHSWPRHEMGVSGQHHAPAAIYPWKRTPGTHCTGGWVGLGAGLDTEVRGKILCPCQGSNLDRPVVQSVARNYIGWATRLLDPTICYEK